MDIPEKHREILAFIQSFSEENGYPPSLRDISRHFGQTSPNSARHHLEKMAESGLIERHPGKFRGIKVAMGEGFGRLTKIPVLGRVQAGELSLAVEEREDTLAVDPNLFPSSGPDDLFALRVNGDSMINAGIRDGDLAVVSRDAHYYNNSIVVAIVDEEATVKRFRRDKGRVLLIPENPAYREIVLRGDDEGVSFQIAGRVVGIIRTAV